MLECVVLLVLINTSLLYNMCSHGAASLYINSALRMYHCQAAAVPGGTAAVQITETTELFLFLSFMS